MCWLIHLQSKPIDWFIMMETLVTKRRNFFSTGPSVTKIVAPFFYVTMAVISFFKAVESGVKFSIWLFIWRVLHESLEKIDWKRFLTNYQSRSGERYQMKNFSENLKL